MTSGKSATGRDCGGPSPGTCHWWSCTAWREWRPGTGGDGGQSYVSGEEPPPTFKEYDPEWARAFWTGSATASCDHARMLSAVKVPVLFTHRFRHVDETTGRLQGALTDLQARHVRELVTGAGQHITYESLPDAPTT
ncbi:hypothetical protein RVR_8851 [Actinacidiphila reveromycinica]|uniref:Uncharacterized protein n=1 Tax=Actinacidiphila reveromycinica TaxID=659352 RepID=A0A7U3UYZ3_9ACTN|nr:hypothetical protein [Streptomyces sp. SN-593]BBB01433.1 hypothetical protein RVR_8851 [Streptomyces sp. SN-593]